MYICINDRFWFKPVANMSFESVFEAFAPIADKYKKVGNSYSWANNTRLLLYDLKRMTKFKLIHGLEEVLPDKVTYLVDTKQAVLRYYDELGLFIFDRAPYVMTYSFNGILNIEKNINDKMEVIRQLHPNLVTVLTSIRLHMPEFSDREFKLTNNKKDNTDSKDAKDNDAPLQIIKSSSPESIPSTYKAKDQADPFKHESTAQ